MGDQENGKEGGRLANFLRMLESDRDNLALMSDTAEIALQEQRPDVATNLLDRHAGIAPLPPRETNLAGLAALQSGRHEKAAALFQQLLDGGANDASLRFNLAWSRAMLKDFDAARALLNEDVTRALPQAAMLEVQVLHETGAFDEAAQKARTYVDLHPDHRGLMAAVSVLALDVEDPDLAARCAAQAGDHPDGLATLGTLALGEERPADALILFDKALARDARVPRAWVGRGLAKLLTGNATGAAADVDRGAEMFGRHLGSWIAAGWAHFLNRDYETSRARFDTALELDPTFAEAQGSLAVLDIVEGQAEEGRRRSEIALRLDRGCYSAALAQVLLAAGSADPAQAQRIFDLAINSSVDGSGRTIAQSLARLGLSGG